jgi:hypothetical protein
MIEPKIEILKESKLGGASLKAEFPFKDYQVIIYLNGLKGMYSPIELIIDLKGKEEYEEFPFDSEVKNFFIDDQGDKLVATTDHKAKRIFEDLCLSLEGYVSIDELNYMNKYLRRIITMFDRQYKRK